jgi:hypothetical protein
MSTATPSWVMTYDSLTQAVLQSLERSDTSTQNYVPDGHHHGGIRDCPADQDARAA